MCPTVLNVLHAEVASPVKFLLNSNQTTCYFLFDFCFSSYSLLIKSHRHLIISLHLELDDVVRWEQSLVPMLYNEASIGELRSIMVPGSKFQVKNVKKHHNFDGRKTSCIIIKSWYWFLTVYNWAHIHGLSAYTL